MLSIFNQVTHVTQALPYDSKRILLDFTSLVKKICLISVIAFSFYALYRIVKHFVLKVKTTSAQPPLFSSTVTTIDQGKTFLYLKSEEIKGVGQIEKQLYQDAVVNLPICCVDVFLYNPIQKTYLLVYRKDPPAKDTWWLPGGRLYKGESFFDCAKRKCQEEIGKEVEPIDTLGLGATLFPDSMWKTQTHTVNTLVLAFVKDQDMPKLDKTSTDYAWKAITSPPDDPYVFAAYQKALEIIK